jgi:hypothetical protein
VSSFLILSGFEHISLHLRLVITSIQDGTPASGHLQVRRQIFPFSDSQSIPFPFKVGDTILTVNGRAVSTIRDFYRVIRVAHPVAKINIKRPRTREETPTEVRQDKGDNLPQQIASVITRRPGYHYKVRVWRRRMCLNKLTKSLSACSC